MKQVRAKKALGQHFLIDLSIAQRIAETVDEALGKMPILEIGPGMGVLTQFFLDKGHDLYAIELDKESIEYLMQHKPNLNGRLYSADFLKMDLDQIFPNGQKFALTGNYPYNISSQIFFKLLEHRDQIPLCTGMLQKEVAQRLASPPGNKDYGILSVLLQAWYDVEYLFTVDENVFNPPPKVKSGVIRLRRNDKTCLGCDEKDFKKVVKTAFNLRRKTLRNSLKGMISPGKEEVLSNEIFNKRPEQLSVEEFVDLTNMIITNKGTSK
ncbi:16S rRNA (adenine(1518)-N(6)/adenine(1519)-N(6))-dimethyltransferase RsmA [Falsiporphyromonas endometrii]|uniref:Ribosomal RNA small subunit methyltransferase A n=1 Tax=Falsiporphyromonas endometrii TaxID=1387297 RepID=A0ABV9K7L7_9PORP